MGEFLRSCRTFNRICLENQETALSKQEVRSSTMRLCGMFDRHFIKNDRPVHLTEKVHMIEVIE